MPFVHVNDLGFVHLPDRHPRAADRPCVIQGCAIEHPDDGVWTVTLLAGQCRHSCAEFSDNAPAVADVQDGSWLPTAHRTIGRLYAFAPDAVHLAHDRSIWRRTP